MKRLLISIFVLMFALILIPQVANAQTPDWAYPAAHWLGTPPDQISTAFDAWVKQCTSDCAFLTTSDAWNKAYYTLVNRFLEERGSPDAFIVDANGDAQGLTFPYQNFVYPYIFLQKLSVPRGVQP